MQKLTLTKVTRNERKSERTGKTFTSVGIQTVEYGSRWLSGFGRNDNATWKEGDVIEVEVTESDRQDKSGQPYLNFTMPERRPAGGLSEADRNTLIAMQTALARIEAKLDQALTTTEEMPLPDFDS